MHGDRFRLIDLALSLAPGWRSPSKLNRIGAILRGWAAPSLSGVFAYHCGTRRGQTPRARGCKCSLRCEARGLTPFASGAHVQENPDRQSRRDRLPHHQDRAQARHQDGRGLLRGRSRRPARGDGRRGGRHRPAAGRAVLSGDRQDRRGLPRHRRRGRAPGLRLPVRARGLPRGAGEGRHRLHRPQSAAPSPPWATRSRARRRPPRPRSRPCRAISARSPTPSRP